MENQTNVQEALENEAAAKQAQAEALQNAKNKNAYKRNQTIFVWGWLALPIVSWIIFYWYVNFSSFVGAFQDPITGAPSWVNFEQIWKEIWSDKGNLGSLAVGFENTMKYFVQSIVVMYPLQLVVCYFLYKQIKGYKVFRFILYMPAILPGVALATVFKEMVASNGILAMLGFQIPAQGLLGTPETTTDTVLVYVMWTGICGHMLLLCGAMNRIPIEVLEAARLDGIGPGKEFIYLIIPMIWPTLSTLLTLSCCGILNASGPILLLAADSYSLRSTTISYWIFEKVYANGVQGAGQYNLVSAAGLLLSCIAVPLVLGIRKLFDLLPTVEY